MQTSLRVKNSRGGAGLRGPPALSWVLHLGELPGYKSEDWGKSPTSSGREREKVAI